MKTTKQALQNLAFGLAYQAGVDAAEAVIAYREIDIDGAYLLARGAKVTFRMLRENVTPQDWKAILANARLGARRMHGRAYP